MSNDILKSLNEVNKPVVEGVRELNKLTVASLEKALNLQLASVKTYTDAVLANVKAGVEIIDLKAAQDYAGRQGEVAKGVYETLVKNGKALAEVGSQYNADVTKLVRGRIETAGKNAPAKKAA